MIKRLIQALDVLVTSEGAIGAVEAPHTTAVVTWKATLSEASKSLATLKGKALRTDLRRLVIVPDSSADDVYHTTDGSDADATSPKFPAYGLSEPVTKDVADQYRFYGDAVSLTVKEYGE